MSESKTLTIPEAGARYFGLSKNSSYAAAERGEIPFIQVGRLKRVPVKAMDALLDAAIRTK
jgi:excisionase family DNA binding protein